MAKQLVLKVVGHHKLHCSGCERTVEFILSQLPGVQNVKADHRNQRIEVRIKSEDPDLGKLQSELDLAGYKVEAE
jgi:copper chaperone CopZ